MKSLFTVFILLVSFAFFTKTHAEEGSPPADLVVLEVAYDLSFCAIAHANIGESGKGDIFLSKIISFVGVGLVSLRDSLIIMHVATKDYMETVTGLTNIEDAQSIPESINCSSMEHIITKGV